MLIKFYFSFVESTGVGIPPKQEIHIKDARCEMRCLVLGKESLPFISFCILDGVRSGEPCSHANLAWRKGGGGGAQYFDLA